MLGPPTGLCAGVGGIGRTEAYFCPQLDCSHARNALSSKMKTPLSSSWDMQVWRVVLEGASVAGVDGGRHRPTGKHAMKWRRSGAPPTQPSTTVRHSPARSPAAVDRTEGPGQGLKNHLQLPQQIPASVPPLRDTWWSNTQRTAAHRTTCTRQGGTQRSVALIVHPARFLQGATRSD